MSAHRDDPGLALVPLPQNKPARFEAWPEEAKDRCKALWGTIANRNASRVEWLYSREVPAGTAIPAAATIRRWAHDECWGAWFDRDLAESHGKTLRELRTGWLAALQLSQETLIDAMVGRLDDLPHAGAGRIKSAEVVARLVAQSGLLAVVPEPEPAGEPRAWESMTLEEQEAFMSDKVRRRGKT